MDSASVAPLAERIWTGGELAVGDVSGTFTVSAGKAAIRNLSATVAGLKLAGEASGDLGSSETSATITLTPDAGKEALAGAEPAVTFIFEGVPGDMGRLTDTSALEGYLSLRAFEQEQRRVEILQAAVLEKQRLRREIIAANAREARREEERLAEQRRIEELQRRQEAERLAREEADARRKAEEEVARKAAEEEAARKAAEEVAARKAAEKKAAEEEAARKAAEEAAARKAAEEAAARKAARKRANAKRSRGHCRVRRYPSPRPKSRAARMSWSRNCRRLPKRPPLRANRSIPAICSKISTGCSSRLFAGAQCLEHVKADRRGQVGTLRPVGIDCRDQPRHR